MYTNNGAVEIKGKVRDFGDFFRRGIAGVPTVLSRFSSRKILRGRRQSKALEI
jgi:hypothetical protein